MATGLASSHFCRKKWVSEPLLSLNGVGSGASSLQGTESFLLGSVWQSRDTSEPGYPFKADLTEAWGPAWGEGSWGKDFWDFHTEMWKSPSQR